MYFTVVRHARPDFDWSGCKFLELLSMQSIQHIQYVNTTTQSSPANLGVGPVKFCCTETNFTETNLGKRHGNLFRVWHDVNRIPANLIFLKFVVHFSIASCSSDSDLGQWTSLWKCSTSFVSLLQTFWKSKRQHVPSNINTCSSRVQAKGKVDWSLNWPWSDILSCTNVGAFITCKSKSCFSSGSILPLEWTVSLGRQVVVGYAATKGYLDKSNVSEITSFQESLLKEIDPAILKEICERKIISDTLDQSLKQFFDRLTNKFVVAK